MNRPRYHGPKRTTFSDSRQRWVLLTLLSVLFGTSLAFAPPTPSSSAKIISAVHDQVEWLVEQPDIHLKQVSRALRPMRGFKGRNFGVRSGRAMRASPAPTRPRSSFRAQAQSTNFTKQLSVTRNQASTTLRRSLRGVKGDGKHAHHIVPFGLKDHPMVRRAAKGGFNINGKRNGILLSSRTHENPRFHPQYTKRVRETLDGLMEATRGKQIKNWQYAQVLDNLAKKEKRYLRLLPKGSRLE